MSAASDFTLHDLTSETPQPVLDAFRSLIARIAASSDRNRANYAGLDASYASFDSFTLVTDGERPVAFSCLCQDRFPDGLPRALTKFYYDPSYRFGGIKGAINAGNFALPPVMTGLMLEHQFARAVELGKSAVFISVEFLRRRAFAQSLTDYLNHYQVAGGGWRLSPDMHLTCPAPHSPNCWQNIVFKPITPDYRLELDAITLEDWQDRFGVSHA